MCSIVIRTNVALNTDAIYVLIDILKDARSQVQVKTIHVYRKMFKIQNVLFEEFIGNKNGTKRYYFPI